jgi:hypothetical protein
MPRRSKTTKKRRKRQTGKGPVGDWFKKTARNIHDFVKDKKLVSRGLSGLASIGSPYSTHLATASNVAKTLGYGRKRKARRSKTRK